MGGWSEGAAWTAGVGQRIWVPPRRVERPDEGRLAARFWGDFGASCLNWEL